MGLLDNATGILKDNAIATAVGAGIVGAGVGVAVGAAIGARTKKKTRKSSTKRGRIKHTKRGWAQDRRRFNKRQKWEVAYRRRKKHKKGPKSHRRGKIYYAKKTGQPYILLSSGKAKFIKGKRRAR